MRQLQQPSAVAARKDMKKSFITGLSVEVLCGQGGCSRSYLRGEMFLVRQQFSFLFFSSLLRNNQHTSLYKFKACTMMV